MTRMYSPAKQKVLLLLAAGLALGLSRSPLTHWRILRSPPRALRDIDRQYLYRILREFRKERLVSYRERDNGNIDIVLTEEGKRRTLVFKLDSLQIKKPGKWDGWWRVVLYDIPEKKKLAREALRGKLKKLGFREWQKSVWVHPYPCRDKIDFIVEVFDLRAHVRYAEFIKPTNEAELKLRFKLV